MILEPRSPWVLVELSFDKEEPKDFVIDLPEDYRPATSPYKAVSVVDDPDGEYKHGDVIVLPTHVIREIELTDNTFHLVERNHIMAAVRA